MAAFAAVTGLTLVLAACSGSDSGNKTTSASAPAAGDITGNITVLTNRTDIVDTVFQDYKTQFEAEYPGVTVTFQAIKDYDGEVTTRMSTSDYGDVLLIPTTVTPADLGDFFEPLGKVDDLAKDYRFVKTEQNFDGVSYGLAITGNVNGLVYNKKVWADAGVKELPTTPEQFQSDLQAIKDSSDAVPLYTNYKDGWPLTQWESDRCGVTADPNCVNALATTDAPWTEGSDHFVIDSLIFDAVKGGLTEADPTTTNWDQSKIDLATGKIATMALGSWSIQQMMDAATTAGMDPADIGYMPFPAQVDGKFHSVASGDWKNGINVNSKNKDAARAWLFWFADKSGYATANGGLSPRLDGPMPSTLGDFDAAGVEYLELTPADVGQESVVNDIDTQAEIGLWSPDYRQRIVDAARGASGETKESIFADLNSRWAAAKADIVG